MRDIQSVAVIGGGTMGSGIAAASAAAGVRVLLLEKDQASAAKARERALAQAAEGEDLAGLIEAAPLDAGLAALGGYDWVCEAIVEDLAAKRDLFAHIEPLRRDGSVVSTNTSGIPLGAITEGLPERLLRDIVVTHFFNPVRVMRLLELIPGRHTDPEVVDTLAEFSRRRLHKGVVFAKDTVNFIANRIGCFWMLAGLHKARPYLDQGLSIERIDALMAAPVGLPPTGLYGLIDLIGLDVMDHVGTNLAANLPAGDPGHAFVRFPPAEAALLARGQLGRKSGGGFYRVVKLADGSKRKEVFDGAWRAVAPVALPDGLTDARALFFSETPEGRFAWDLFGDALLYAADLVPGIADDIVNVDRAMRWGFNWRRGPFELLDHIGPDRVIGRLLAENRRLPRMLAVLAQTGATSFYREGRYLGTDGAWHALPPE